MAGVRHSVNTPGWAPHTPGYAVFQSSSVLTNSCCTYNMYVREKLVGARSTCQRRQHDLHCISYYSSPIILRGARQDDRRPKLGLQEESKQQCSNLAVHHIFLARAGRPKPSHGEWRAGTARSLGRGRTTLRKRRSGVTPRSPGCPLKTAGTAALRRVPSSVGCLGLFSDYVSPSCSIQSHRCPLPLCCACVQRCFQPKGLPKID